MNAPPVDPESTSKQENETIFDVLWVYQVYNPFLKDVIKTIENETREGYERLSETLSPHFADEKVEQCDLHHLPKVIKI